MSRESRFADPAGGPAVQVDRHGADMVAIERAAIAVLDSIPGWIWDGEPPVPVERIATDHFGLLIREAEDPSTVPGAPAIPEGDHLSGFLLAKRGEIWVNGADAREWPPRKRFTIAHELGHWVLHRDLFSKADGPPAQAAPLADADGKPVLAMPEAEANAFAAALLLPARPVREFHSRCGGDIEAVKRHFDSSHAALKRRFATLGIDFPEEPPPEARTSGTD